MQFFKAITVKRTPPLNLGDAENFFSFDELLESRLHIYEFRERRNVSSLMTGFVEVNEGRMFERLPSGGLLFRVRMDARNVPASAVTEEVNKREEASPEPLDRNELQSLVYSEMLNATPPVTTRVKFIVHEQLLLIPTGSASVSNVVCSLFQSVFDVSLVTVGRDVKGLITAQFRDWIDEQSRTEDVCMVGGLPFYLGEKITLKKAGSGISDSLSLKHSSLVDLLCGPLREEVARCDVSDIQLGNPFMNYWFTLKANGTVSGIEYFTEDDEFVEWRDGETEEEHAQREQERYLIDLDVQVLLVLSFLRTLWDSLDIKHQPIEVEANEQAERQEVIITDSELLQLIGRLDRISAHVIQRETGCGFVQADRIIRDLFSHGHIKPERSYYVKQQPTAEKSEAIHEESER